MLKYSVLLKQNRHIYLVFQNVDEPVFTSEHCDAVQSSVQHRSDCEPSCLGGTSGPFD